MFLNRIISKIKWIPFSRTEKAKALKNPYCGMYTIFRIYAKNNRILPNEEIFEKYTMDPNQQICLLEINLVHFAEGPLTESALGNIRNIFHYLTTHKKQLIVRFLYDWEGNGLLNEPKEIKTILNHMNQLSPLLKEYTKSIYILQGLFIGSWGEMHNSRYTGEQDMFYLAKQLYQCSGEETQIALRCPSFWRMLFKTHKPLDSSTAFTGTPKSRFSLFNDAMMASDTDFGTYGSISAVHSNNCSDKWTRIDEHEFQNNLCKYVSNGGEVINKSHYNDGLPAIETLRKLRVSYLNSEYDKKVLDKWKTSNSGQRRALWRNKSAFDYIAAHLGYRFTLVDAKMWLVNDKKGNLKACVKIVNKGFAPCYNKFYVKFVISTMSFSEVYEYAVDTDTRMWMPDKKIELEREINVSELKQGRYLLCFGIYDQRSEQAIHIANTHSVLEHTGVYRLGTFNIDGLKKLR